ncbi:MAG: ATP-dependent RecD-like DNA helicase [Firmicutes bacterium]|jgi:exodeoxyribonuclease V alpha subunit|nr:ATP-dependent RecD-like DNA helicase [Bacillota bacterium]
MTERKGCIEDIIFYNEENGYLVALVSDESGGEGVVTGNLPFAREGSSYVFFGEDMIHPKYGIQFRFENYKEVVPETESGIIAFLASGMIRGVGRKTAELIVGRFGKDTLTVMEKDPSRLLEVDGIGEKKLEAIRESFGKHIELSAVIMFLQENGIPASYAGRIYRRYGAHAVSLIRENPYRLADEIWGIGFKTADSLASGLGMEKDSRMRIRAGIKYVLSRESLNGHTYLGMEELTEWTARMLELSSEAVEEELQPLAMEEEIRIERLEGRVCVFLMGFYQAETRVCSDLIRLIGEEHKPLFADVEGLILRAESRMGIRLEEEQIRAVESAAENGVCIITGGPGTGKTTIINTIVRMFEASGFEIALAAPTGRAAKRITETSGFEAKTLHRLLEYSRLGEGDEGMYFARDEESPLEADVVIVDEASMIDILLMKALLCAMKPGSRLVLVGDADQLPPVGAGNVLRDMIDSEMVHTVKLNRIFRQAQESLIVVNAHRINHGEYPYYNEKDKDFFFLRKAGEQRILETILDLCSTRLPAYYEGLDPVRDIQVISPVKKGLTGTINLNKELQETLNPPREDLNEKQIGSRLFREGDKVMQIRNNYDIAWRRIDDFSEGEGIFNGDIGFIQRIDPEMNEITVVFEETRAAVYDATRFDELELAYAVTVHKSQGSEYPLVVMPMTWIPPIMATRNLLYTGVTRARKMVTLVGDPAVMNQMVDNNRITQRNSGLKSRLRVFLDFE